MTLYCVVFVESDDQDEIVSMGVEDSFFHTKEEAQNAIDTDYSQKKEQNKMTFYPVDLNHYKGKK